MSVPMPVGQASKIQSARMTRWPFCLFATTPDSAKEFGWPYSLEALGLFAWAKNAAKLLLVISLLAAYLPGCTLIPDHERPSPPVATEFPDAATASATAPTAIGLGWAEFFGDERLQSLITTALDNNRDLRRAVQRIKEARALYGIRRADQLPAISGDASLTRSRTPADLSFTGGAVTASQYQAGLGLSAWELDFWGRVASLKESALQNYLASEETHRAVLISLVGQVANTYLLERELDERLAIAQRTTASRKESYRIAKRRYEVGSSSRLDAAQAEILLNQARSEWTVVGRLRAQTRNALTLLVGAALAADGEIPLSQVEAQFMRDIAPGLPSDLLLNRPDIRSAEHQLQAANANVGTARAAFFPRITLTGAFGSASGELSGLFDSGSHAWTFLPALSLPLFDGGRNQANLDLAHARRNLAVADYEHAIQVAFREVADALAGRRWLGEQVATQQGTLAAQTERAILARLRYDNGAASYLEVLDAERDRFAAEMELVQTRRALLASGVSLYAALGGGATSNTASSPEGLNR